MSKFRVVIHDIDEFVYEVETSDEQQAIEEANAMWAFDGGPQRDHQRYMVTKLPEGGA